MLFLLLLVPKKNYGKTSSTQKINSRCRDQLFFQSQELVELFLPSNVNINLVNAYGYKLSLLYKQALLRQMESVTEHQHCGPAIVEDA